MKKLIMLLCLGFIVFQSQAQPEQRGRRPEPPSIAERVEKAEKDLNLSEDQVTQWTAIFKKYDEQMKTARENRDREKGQELMEKMTAELKATLNEEQATKFAAMQEKRKG
ncbi:MAG: hypothetical protein AAFU64_15095, partial [Bacteroidota bacterium]